MTPQTRVFLLAPTLLALVLVSLAPLALASAPSVPLEWKYSGSDLPPGYMVDVTVKAEGCWQCGGLADAGFMVAEKRFGVTQDGRDVYVFFEGHPYKIDTLPWLFRKQYNTVFTLKLYCPGTAPPGERPVQGYLWLEVTEHAYTGVTHRYLIPDPGPGGAAPGIYWFSEENPIIKGSVHVGKTVRFADCGGYEGNPPSPGEGVVGDPYKNQHEPLDLERLALIGLGGTFALAGLAVLAGRRGG